MSSQTIARTAPPLAARFPGKYISLVSFKRDGTPVATPLWFVVDGERLLAITDAHSAKVKRIRRDPEVTVAPCRAERAHHRSGDPGPGRSSHPASSSRPRQLMARKYRVDRVLILPVYNLVQRLRGKRPSR